MFSHPGMVYLNIIVILITLILITVLAILNRDKVKYLIKLSFICNIAIIFWGFMLVLYIKDKLNEFGNWYGPPELNKILLQVIKDNSNEIIYSLIPIVLLFLYNSLVLYRINKNL